MTRNQVIFLAPNSFYFMTPFLRHPNHTLSSDIQLPGSFIQSNPLTIRKTTHFLPSSIPAPNEPVPPASTRAHYAKSTPSLVFSSALRASLGSSHTIRFCPSSVLAATHTHTCIVKKGALKTHLPIRNNQDSKRDDHLHEDALYKTAN